MSDATSAYSVSVEERVRGETVWVAIRARGAEWSWLTPAEAARLGRLWVEKYGNRDNGGPPGPAAMTSGNQLLLSRTPAHEPDRAVEAEVFGSACRGHPQADDDAEESLPLAA